MDSNNFYLEKIIYINRWKNNLISFRISRNVAYSFTSGQFARLGIYNKNKELIWRPYSIASNPNEDYLEFYFLVVDNGEFTQILKDININNEIYLHKSSYGLLTNNRFVDGKDLWLLSTGTGLAPFLSIIQNKEILSNYEKIIIVHCVKTKNEFTYQEEICNIAKNYNLNKLIYVKVVTRDTTGADLYGRITTLIENNKLEDYVKIKISIQNSRVMICGNPEMVSDTRKLLSIRGLTMSKRSLLGNMAVENYW